MKVLFLGSSHFSTLVLSKMLEEGVSVKYCITQPDRPSGRGHKVTPTELKTFALSKGIEVLTFDKLRLHLDEIRILDFDISVVASYGQILPDEFLNMKLCINVHPSLLPKYRGASPIQNTILNGDEEGGVTIMKVASQVDAGDIIMQKKVEINGEYFSQLEEKFASLGGGMVVKVIEDYQNGKMIFTPQDHLKATFTRKFEKEDGRLDFCIPASEIVNRVRALAEEVGCDFYVDDLRIKVEKMADVSDQYKLKPYEILNDKKHFVIGCNGGAVEVLTCRAPSGKTVSGKDFLNGHNELLAKRIKPQNAKYIIRNWSE